MDFSTERKNDSERRDQLYCYTTGAPVNLYNLMLIATMMVKIIILLITCNDDDRNHDYVGNDSRDEVQLAINKIQTDFNTDISNCSDEERLQLKIDHNYNYH